MKPKRKLKQELKLKLKFKLKHKLKGKLQGRITENILTNHQRQTAQTNRGQHRRPNLTKHGEQQQTPGSQIGKTNLVSSATLEKDGWHVNDVLFDNLRDPRDKIAQGETPSMLFLEACKNTRNSLILDLLIFTGNGPSGRFHECQKHDSSIMFSS